MNIISIPPQYSLVNQEKSRDTDKAPKNWDKLILDDNLLIPSERITKEPPSYKPEDEQPGQCKIIIFQCKPEYSEFYNVGIHPGVLKSEDENKWFAIPIKEPYFGIIEWDKKVWEIICEFSIAPDLFL